MYLWDYVCPCRGRRLITEHRIPEDAIRVWDEHAIAIPWSEYVIEISPSHAEHTSTLGRGQPVDIRFDLDFSKISRPPF